MSVRIRRVKFRPLMKDKLDFISPQSTAEIVKGLLGFLTAEFVHRC
jgi:hypothetical protein